MSHAQRGAYSRTVFSRSSTNTWNNFTLLELIADSFEANNNNEPLRFPDLRKRPHQPPGPRDR